MPPRGRNPIGPWSAWCLYTVVLITGVARGGMWLDELQVWCLARDSGSLPHLFHLLRNEGHPPLWPVLVKGLTLITDRPAAMAVLHSLFACGTAWLLLFRAPWPFAWRVLAVAGYFVLFEYAVIARNYGPAMFLLFAGIAARTAGRPAWATACVMGMAFLHYWGIVAAGAYAVMLLPGRNTAERTAAILCAAGAITALWWALPTEALPYQPALDRIVPAELPSALGRLLGQVFLPFPDPSNPRPWNTSWLLDHAPLLHGWLGAACFATALWSVGNRRSALLFFLLTTLGILVFPLLAPFRSIRYVGPILLAFLAALWMDPPRARVKRAAVVVLLALQVPAALFMTVVGWHTPRSQASTSVKLLRNSPYAELPVVVHPYQLSPAVSAYLGRPVYCPATDTMGSYCRWTHHPFRLEADSLPIALQRMPYRTAILICDDATLELRAHSGSDISSVAHPGPALITSEEHHIYLIRKP
ncbi:MAG TPA: hypothetical protein VGE21_04520 [Flavobacteriales bacterium]